MENIPLAEARKERGLGQKDVAAIIDVSVARVSQIEHGEVGARCHRSLCRGTRRTPRLGRRLRRPDLAIACHR
ncbi:helix-turn-helix domain-containing protein [Nonomuraea sp. NPDC051941]|uniref:helix-turn-helix domain-containing protein n=1 Tax=Nonomuraea sp. NPDC051941 TaxID=3364373 RepID=UPI0037C7C6D5